MNPRRRTQLKLVVVFSMIALVSRGGELTARSYHLDWDHWLWKKETPGEPANAQGGSLRGHADGTY